MNVEEELELDKQIITIPKGIRYIGEMNDDGKVVYELKNYPYPHILNKVLTGCGFTEYCINNDDDLILCSPRKMLLENKQEQHQVPNVFYAKNEIDENMVNYEKTLTDAEGRREVRKRLKRYMSFTEAIIEENKKISEEEIQRKKERILEYKNKIKTHYMGCKSRKEPCKILVTYDSFRHVKEALQELGVLNSFQVVIDEFQSILVDCKFKSDAEMELLYHLRGLTKVCFVSATPMLDKYLKRLSDFKDLPYFEFDWHTEDPNRVIKPKLNLHYTNSITTDLTKVIYSYKEGKFEKDSWLDDSGNIIQVVSNEAVLYVNSVNVISSMIIKCELLPDQCNILIARTNDNNTKIRKAFNDVYKKLGLKTKIGTKENLIGSVPTKGEPHKMFTFCTRTVYLGADFYSTCARSFIFCDANIDSLCVDVSMDLPQILGRQRLNENPWKNEADIYIKISLLRLTKEVFDKEIKKKTTNTDALLNIYNKSDSYEKPVLADKYERDTVGSSYKTDYVAVNRHGGVNVLPVFNKLMLVADERAFDIQQVDYADRVSIFNSIDNKFSVEDISQDIEKFNSINFYHDKMEFICLYSIDPTKTREQFRLLLDYVPKSFKNYFIVLGPDKCRAHKYRKGEMEKEYQRLLNNQGVSLEDRIYDTFHAGDRLKKADIKIMLEKIYQDSGFQQTAKAKDLEHWFTLKEIKIRIKGTNMMDNGFELLSRIIPPTINP